MSAKFDVRGNMVRAVVSEVNIVPADDTDVGIDYGGTRRTRKNLLLSYKVPDPIKSKSFITSDYMRAVRHEFRLPHPGVAVLTSKRPTIREERRVIQLLPSSGVTCSVAHAMREF
jgi:hypothetical protein